MAQAAAHNYLHANAAFADELGRLRLLEARCDPHTFRRLATFGPLAGTRCLEVGAGAGSVARWLAAQVGPAGQVVATDADPRFLADAEKAGVEVRRHDIMADPVEPGHYDLAHCRALLFHLADPQRAVRNMAAAVRPGGWLLIEDADYVSLVAVACLRQGGSAEADLLRRSLDRLHPLALTNGVADQQELDAVSAATADPSFSFLDALSVAAWGRVPDPARVVYGLVGSHGGSRNRGAPWLDRGGEGCLGATGHAGR